MALLSACGSYTPSAVENRAKLRSCGEYEIGNEPSSPERLRKNRCILDALAEGRQAELIVTLLPIDGGPITEYVRVLAADRIEVFVDSTRDTEANPRAWSRWLCSDLTENAGYHERLGSREIGLDAS